MDKVSRSLIGFMHKKGKTNYLYPPLDLDPIQNLFFFRNPADKPISNELKRGIMYLYISFTCVISYDTDIKSNNKKAWTSFER